MEILIADDHPMFAKALQGALVRALPSPIRTHTVHNGEDLLAALQQSDRLELVIQDLVMPGHLRRFQLVEAVRSLHSELPLTIMTSCDSPAVLRAALNAKAGGFVAKSSGVRAIHQVVAAVASGGRYFDPAVNFSAAIMHPWFTLSGSERQVALMTAQGNTACAISSATGRAYTTVATHKARVLKELGLESDGQIAPYIYEHDLGFEFDSMPREPVLTAWL